MRLPASAAILLIANVATHAQGLDPLRDALAKVPEIILSQSAPVQFNFVDIAALHTLAATEGKLNAKLLMRAAVGGALPAYNALQMSGPEAWNEKSSIAIADVRYLAGFGDPPNTVSIWGLEGIDAAASLMLALDAGEFDSVGEEGILGNGTPMAMDISKRNPADPWRSNVGAATFAAARDNAIIQAAMPQALQMMLADAPTAGGNTIVLAALDGLETILNEDLLVQAMLISPAFGLGSIDPAALLTQGSDIDSIRQKLEAEVESGSRGIPPYFGGVIADSQGEQPAVLVSLTYADCETAGIAAQEMERRWRDSMPGGAQGDLQSAGVEAGNGLCAATLKLAGDSSDSLSNPAFGGLFDAYLRRSFTVLQIGETP